MSELSEETCKEAGLGQVATEHLLDWYYEEFIDGYERLPFKWVQILKVSKPIETTGVVCISGKLKSYKTKAQATEYLEKLGYLVKSSLTKDVNILVNESGIESAKTQTARERGVIIITNLNEIGK
jgi:NAD-dependent DNA ligase